MHLWIWNYYFTVIFSSRRVSYVFKIDTYPLLICSPLELLWVSKLTHLWLWVNTLSVYNRHWSTNSLSDFSSLSGVPMILLCSYYVIDLRPATLYLHMIHIRHNHEILLSPTIRCWIHGALHSTTATTNIKLEWITELRRWNLKWPYNMSNLLLMRSGACIIVKSMGSHSASLQVPLQTFDLMLY